MSKRLLALLLALLMLVSTFASCAQQADDAVTETTEATAPTSDIEIMKDGYTEYVMIYDSGISEDTLDSLKNTVNRWSNQNGMPFELKSDKAVSEVTEVAKEILIGDTNRPESSEAKERIRTKEYVVYYDTESTRVVINSDREIDLSEALSYFFRTWADTETKSITLPPDAFYIKTQDFSIRSITVGDVNLMNYRIVIPTDADLLTKYAAFTLVDHVSNYLGVELEVVKDSKKEQPYEILIGDTNRKESDTGVTLSGAQYVLMQSGDKLVMQGEGVYTAAGVGAFVSKYLLPNAENTLNREIKITDLPKTAEVKEYKFADTHENAILLIGDGMGQNSINAALANGLSSFIARDLEVEGEAITRSWSVIADGADWTDSAAAATAMATGYKTTNYTVGLDKDGNEVQNIRELAEKFGANTAVVTTDSLTGATPSAFLAHSSNRYDSKISSDISKSRKNMAYCEGGIDGSNLTNQSRKALSEVTKSSDPFFVMIEEAHIDKRAHADDMAGVIQHVKYYNDLIAYVICFTLCHPDTALIITADHETGGIREGNENTDDDDGEKYGYEFTVWEGTPHDSKRAHTNQNVPLYAFGANIDEFDEVATENTDIARFIAKAFGDNDFGDSTPLE